MNRILLTVAALVAASAVSADEVKYGDTKCVADTSGCVIFLGPMSEDELIAAGMNLTSLDAANDLIDLTKSNQAPAYTWLIPAG